MYKGTIIKIISNQYTIDSSIGQIVAVPRGKMRREDKPVVGDLVEFEQIEDSYRIASIFPRKNRLLRPAISNVDQALVVTSLKDPDYSDHLLNRLIFLISLANIKPAIVVTKMDLVDDKDKFIEEFNKYEKAGYEVFYSYPGNNDDKLKELISNKISVLCGQSGAGKSSLLNRLDPTFQLRTQEISKALGRGKHTTRHCELHQVADGWVADTPGFSSLDFTRLDTDHLDEVILDFKPFIGQCRFKDCIHINEPDCAIKNAMNDKLINESIYEDYKQIKLVKRK